MDFLVIIAFILTSTTSTICEAERHRTDITSPGENRLEWDHLLLVLQWPPTVCRVFGKDCRKSSVKNNWTIHGLWPTQGSSGEPVDCNNSSHFEPEQIKDLREVMNQTWGSLNMSSTNEWFWAHEWKRHGTCAAQLISLHRQHDYFARTLKLSSVIDLYSILARADIIPSEALFYPSDLVRAAIERGLGHAVGMYCTADGPNLLMEVEICYDLSFNMIECEKMFREPCDPELKIKIPPKS